MQQPKSDLGRLMVEVSRSHTTKHAHTHASGRTRLKEWPARLRNRYLQNTQQTQETNIHALSGIRTRDPSNQTASDLGLRPHSHRDRLKTWVTEQILPPLPPESIIVTDNANIHSVLMEKVPYASTRKPDTKVWLRSQNIPYTASQTRAELQPLINMNKKHKCYELHMTAMQCGHTIDCRRITATPTRLNSHGHSDNDDSDIILYV